MKNNKTLLITISLVLGFIALTQIVLQNQADKKLDKHIIEFPGEWMYNQRAYPNNFINKTAINNADLKIKSIKNSRNKDQGGSWVLEGPLNTGGRVTDVAISPVNDNHLYVGTALGGIFKTIDQGENWIPIFDDVSKSSIGNIAIAPSNENIIYVGTGEANASATSGAFFGDGIYKSTNAGETWTNIGLPESGHIGRIVIDPTNPDKVFVAATGTLYGTNEERGIYRTLNGGTTWERILFTSSGTAAIDVAINPNNPNILFAAMWERIRQPWQRDYAGLTSVIHRSLDGGNTWQELGVSQGLPAPDEATGRIGIAISPSNPENVYARFTTNEITNEFNGLYKSTNNGDDWSLITLSEISNVDSFFGWYFGNLRVHPTNPDLIYVLGQRLYRTTNSGQDWNEVFGMHVDHHAMEFSNNNTDLILAGNDGGAYLSSNGGNSWNKFENLPITQFYNIEVDNTQPERLYGGTQDNNTIRTTTGNLNDYTAILGGDGFHVNVDPNDNNFVYAEFQFGNLFRSTDGGNTMIPALIGVNPNDRTNWNTPVVLSNFNPEIVYYGSNILYTSNRAELWTSISEDLTNGQHPSGSLSYGTLTAIGTSYNNTDVIYTGSDDGKIHRTINGGATWTDISNGLPNRYITAIATTPDNDNIAYVTLSGFANLDYDPHVFKTEDGGQTWNAISGNLPNIPANDIIVYGNTLFVATDAQVWYSLNDGLNWDTLGTNLPNTIIRDLKIHQETNTLYAGTFGRSIQSYDLNEIALNTNDFNVSEVNISIHPNPADNFIEITHDIKSNGSISLYDIQGKKTTLLFSGNLEASKNTPFSVSNLPSGLYFI